MRLKLTDFHQLFGHPPEQTLHNLKQHPEYHDILTELREQETGLHPFLSDSIVLEQLELLPPLESVRLPNFSPSFSVGDLELMTPDIDRRLWLDLKYDQQNRPALTDMFIVSRGSRKVVCTPDRLRDILDGREFSTWKSHDIGAITIVRTDDGQLMSIQQAVKHGLGGEVLCIVK
jgi:ribosomal protein S8